MIAACFTTYFVLTLVAAVMQTVNYRKMNDVGGRGIIVCAAATIAALIAFMSLDSGDSASGGFIYYVNGVRTGAGIVQVGLVIFFAFMSFVVSYGISVGLGYLFGHWRSADEKAKAKVWVLILSILGVQFGGGLLRAGISRIADISTPGWRHILVVVLGVAILGWSIWGIISFIKKRKTNRQ